jgi:hypothetical protein
MWLKEVFHVWRSDQAWARPRWSHQALVAGWGPAVAIHRSPAQQPSSPRQHSTRLDRSGARGKCPACVVATRQPARPGRLRHRPGRRHRRQPSGPQTPPPPLRNPNLSSLLFLHRCDSSPRVVRPGFACRPIRQRAHRCTKTDSSSAPPDRGGSGTCLPPFGTSKPQPMVVVGGWGTRRFSGEGGHIPRVARAEAWWWRWQITCGGPAGARDTWTAEWGGAKANPSDSLASGAQGASRRAGETLGDRPSPPAGAFPPAEGGLEVGVCSGNPPLQGLTSRGCDGMGRGGDVRAGNLPFALGVPGWHGSCPECNRGPAGRRRGTPRGPMVVAGRYPGSRRCGRAGCPGSWRRR